MSRSNNIDDSSKLHITMFPWFAFGHFIPFLHLSNKLAGKGHRISFLLPRGAQEKMEPHNHHPDLIHLIPLAVPSFHGLPPGTETASDVNINLHQHLALAFDQTRNQVESILNTQSPDFVFYDFGHWVPSVARSMGIKCIFNVVVSSHGIAWAISPEIPPRYPFPQVKLTIAEAEAVKKIMKEKRIGADMSLDERITTGLKQSDAVAFRTCRIIEGSSCDYLAQQLQKPVLLTGHLLETKITEILDDKWENWLGKFEQSSVVYCALGSQIALDKDQFQELLLGFELAGQPFLLALKPPEGCTTVEEAFPEGFLERVEGRGWVHGGWVPQPGILGHPSVGCYVSHNGYSSFWESLLSDCQIVLIPFIRDQILNARYVATELKVGVEVERGNNGWVSKEDLSKAIKLAMDKDGEIANVFKVNHAKLKQCVSSPDVQENYLNKFIQSLRDLKERV